MPPQICDLRAAVLLDEHVLRFQVAVDDAVIMDVGKAVTNAWPA